MQREEGTTLVTAHNVNTLDGALVKITRTTTKVFLSICRFKTSWRGRRGRGRGRGEKSCGLWAPVPGNVLVHPNMQALVEWSSSIQHCSCHATLSCPDSGVSGLPQCRSAFAGSAATGATGATGRPLPCFGAPWRCQHRAIGSTRPSGKSNI